MRRSAFSRVRYARIFTTVLRNLLLAGFFHARRLALQLAQEVQLGAADLRRAQHFDLVDDRRVEREDALDALAEGDLSDGEGRARAAAMHADHHPLEHLDALLVPFAHLDVDLHGVPGLDRRALCQLPLLDSLYRSHDFAPSSFYRSAGTPAPRLAAFTRSRSVPAA